MHSLKNTYFDKICILEMPTNLENAKSSTQATIQTINQRIDGDKVAVFDPRVKFASKEKEAEATIVWSSKSIELALKALDEGQGLRVSPFLKSDPNLRKANLVFQYTEEEIEELIHCKKDIIYFAEKYVLLKTEKGLQHIKLRPYQKRLLQNYQNNRWCITLQARQSGKCLSYNNNLDILIGGIKYKMSIGNIYNLYRNSITKKEKIIIFLYKLYKLLDKWKQKL